MNVTATGLDVTAQIGQRAAKAYMVIDQHIIVAGAGGSGEHRRRDQAMPAAIDRTSLAHRLRDLRSCRDPIRQQLDVGLRHHSLHGSCPDDRD
jgi:hypothetical protein